MKTEIGDLSMLPFVVHKVGNDAIIKFYENPEEVVREEGSKSWIVDEYELVFPYREGLSDSIQSSLSEWMILAKQNEQAAPQKTVEERVSTVEEVVNTIVEVIML